MLAMTQLFPQLARDVRDKRRQQDNDRLGPFFNDLPCRARLRSHLRRRAQSVEQFHNRGDRRIEMKPSVDVVADLLNGSVDRAPQIAQFR